MKSCLVKERRAIRRLLPETEFISPFPRDEIRKRMFNYSFLFLSSLNVSTPSILF